MLSSWIEPRREQRKSHHFTTAHILAFKHFYQLQVKNWRANRIKNRLAIKHYFRFGLKTGISNQKPLRQIKISRAFIIYVKAVTELSHQVQSSSKLLSSRNLVVLGESYSIDRIKSSHLQQIPCKRLHQREQALPQSCWILSQNSIACS